MARRMLFNYLRKELKVAIPILCLPFLLLAGCELDEPVGLATVNRARQTLLASTFEPTASWEDVGSAASHNLALGDVDGDGDLDFAIGNSGPNLIYANNGGAYGDTPVWVSGSSHESEAVAFADIDGDGDLELSVANYGSRDSVYFNDGTMLETSPSWTSTMSNSASVALGDLDGDGVLELVMGTSSNASNRVYDNVSGTLAQDAGWLSVDTDTTMAIALGDIDGDGSLDAAYGNGGAPNRINFNTGGGLNTASGWVSSDTKHTRELELGDIDGDGAPELGVANAQNVNQLHSNNGTALSTSAAWTSADAGTTDGIAFGDADADGDLDAAAGGENWAGAIYENSGTALLNTAIWTSVDLHNTKGVAFGDVDGDGDLDLAAVARNISASVGIRRLYVNRSPAFAADDAWTSAELDTTLGLAFGDVDGDGDLDLAVGNDGPNRLYSTSDGQLWTSPTWSSVPTDITTALAFGDVDGDGNLDLAAVNEAAPNRIYANTGTALSASATWTSSDSSTTTSLAFGDIDGDGDLGLAVGNRAGQSNAVYDNDGTTLDTIAPWMSVEQEDTSAVVVGDVHGDGRVDLAAANLGTKNRVYHNLSTGLDSAGAWLSADTELSQGAALGDVNGDGGLDFVVANASSQCNRIYGNTGAGISAASMWCSDGLDNATDIALGDLNHNGLLAIVVANDGDTTQAFENDSGLPSTSPTWSSGVSAAATCLALADSDRDGDLDLAVGHRAAANMVRANPRRMFFGHPNLHTPAISVPVEIGLLGSTAVAPGQHGAEVLSSPTLTIPFVLRDAESQPVQSVGLEFSTAVGPWRRATVTGQTTMLATSPAGIAHTLTWQMAADTVHSDIVTFRLSAIGEQRLTLPYPWHRASLRALSQPYRVHGGAGPDGDSDGVPALFDCDDNNAEMFPGNTEISAAQCGDGIDNDCDGPIDCSDAGCDVALCASCAADLDGDGSRACGPTPDCSDADRNTHPGAADAVCDGLDNDCDGLVDDDFQPEGPCGVGACALTSMPSQCVGGSIVPCSPGLPLEAVERTCGDGIDNDCDGSVDLADAQCSCPDADGDGYDTCDIGHPADTDGLAADCDDGANALNPGASENKVLTCGDGLDQDCDGAIDCSDPECTVNACNTCAADADGDGYRDCGPTPDCVEGDADAYPGGVDTNCDGIDNDCNGTADDNYVVDATCSSGDCTVPSTCVSGVETPCSAAPPSEGSDVTCDGIDGDCDGAIDEDYVWDGSCGVGVCRLTNVGSTCGDGTESGCIPGAPGEVTESSCADGQDNDCDGLTDGADSDCVGGGSCIDNDGDGYGDPGSASCPRGVAADCNDNAPSISPMAEDSVCDGVDDDCDTIADDAYLVNAGCGTGYCRTNNTPSSCTAGTEVACLPSDPLSAIDATCDGTDDDCDGTADDDYVTNSACGVGYCRTSNIPSSCSGGVHVLCQPGLPFSATDATCNNIDDDCDGEVDEQYVIKDGCGVGHCLSSNSASTCVAGVESDCAPGTPLDTVDTTCDGVDDDCSGAIDEDYSPTSQCGAGFCRLTSTASRCVAGIESPCVPGQPLASTDSNCNNLDDDCNGAIDEDYSPIFQCGVGYCRTANTPSSCVDGVESACAPGAPQQTQETSCADGVDNDCDGLTDGQDADCTAETPQIVPGAATSAVVGVPYRFDDDKRVNIFGAVGDEALQLLILDAPEAFVVHAVTYEIGWIPTHAGTEFISLALISGASTQIDRYDFEVNVVAAASSPAQAFIAALPASGSAPLTVTLDGTQSRGSDGSAVTLYAWDTGTGREVSSQLPTLAAVYERPGAYVAQLQIWDALGVSSTARVDVTVTNGAAYPPRGRIVADRLSGVAPLRVSFLCDCSDSDGSVNSVAWSLGDGGLSGERDVEHTFETPGSYRVRLTVDDDDGLAAYDDIAVVVRAGALMPPSVRIRTNTIDDDAPLSVNFHASVADDDGVIERILWTLPDGEIQEGQDIVVPMLEAGYYAVLVQVTDNDGLHGYDEQIITVRKNGTRPPRIVSEALGAAQVGLPYKYDHDATPALQGDRPVLWSLGRRVDGTLSHVPDGMSVDILSGRIEWTPSAEQTGEQRVTLRADNEAGFDEQDFTVTVTGGAAPSEGVPDASSYNSRPSGCSGLRGSSSGAMWLLLCLGIPVRRVRGRRERPHLN